MKVLTRGECLRRLNRLEADIVAFETAADIEVRPLVYIDQSAATQRHACDLSWLRDGPEGFSVDLVHEVRFWVIAYVKRLRRHTEKKLVEAEAEQLRLNAEYGKPVMAKPAWMTAPPPWSQPKPFSDPSWLHA